MELGLYVADSLPGGGLRKLIPSQIKLTKDGNVLLREMVAPVFLIFQPGFTNTT